MRPRGQRTNLSERLEIGERAAEGQSDRQIAAELGCSKWTVRKWRRCFQAQGREGLSRKRGRPVTGILSTFPSELADAIIQIRQAHPGWGADSILLELHLERGWPKSQLPHRSRVAEFLHQQGLTRRYQSGGLPEPKRQTATEAHQEWEMDAQGATQVEGIGSVSLITITDVYSRVKVESYPSIQSCNPSTEDYQLALRRAFMSFGLPQRLTLDHGTVFYDNTTPSPWPTRLHLWLVALGVDVCFTRKRRPTDHAIIERTHQTMTQQALTGQSWPNSEALWEGLDGRREALNHHLPVRTLNRRSPLQAFPEASHSQRYYSPDREPELLQSQRLYDYLAQGRWFRRTNGNGNVRIGGFSYYLNYQLDRREVELSFNPKTAEFICLVEGESTPRTVRAKGLAVTDLMGEMEQFLRLPTYQLSLPFSQGDWRSLHYAQCQAV